MGEYTLVASETTSQVISPTIVRPVVYATIETKPSGVIASLAVDKAQFDAGASGLLLSDYAGNIEQLMALEHVIAGQGSQTLDNNGLLADNVVFTVEYKPAGSGAVSVTAEAVVPTGLLSEGGDPAIERVLMAQAVEIINTVYENLVAAAGGA